MTYYTMNTLTVHYDASSKADMAIINLVKTYLKVERPRTISKEARAIAREVRGVKNGTIATRPLSALLNEL